MISYTLLTAIWPRNRKLCGRTTYYALLHVITYTCHRLPVPGWEPNRSPNWISARRKWAAIFAANQNCLTECHLNRKCKFRSASPIDTHLQYVLHVLQFNTKVPANLFSFPAAQKKGILQCQSYACLHRAIRPVANCCSKGLISSGNVKIGPVHAISWLVSFPLSTVHICWFISSCISRPGISRLPFPNGYSGNTFQKLSYHRTNETLPLHFIEVIVIPFKSVNLLYFLNFLPMHKLR